MIRWFKKRGYTDRLYFANLLFAWSFTIVCILLTILSGKLYFTDMSIVSVGMGVVWGELTVHTGFVIRKAWLENLSKHKDELHELKDLQSQLTDLDDLGGGLG